MLKKLNKKYIAVVMYFLSVFFPAIALAAGTPKTFAELVNLFITIIQLIIILIGGLSLVVFLWGLAHFILSSGDEKEVKDGKRFMLWGVIALFVMTAVWGLVAILTETFGVRLIIPLLPYK